jgi:nucleoside-diphosphate-sugar epimerase
MEIIKKIALVVGAKGVIGSNLIDHLLSPGDWEVIGLARRQSNPADRLTHISVDLLNEADTFEKLHGLNNVTHIFYAAYQDRTNWADLVAPNLAMLTNTVNVIDAVSPVLQHISLMQGYKVYGAHLGPFKTPARETDPGHMPPEFNVDQQNYLEEKQRGRNWSWSAIRPSVVGGTALGNPMNLAVVIAVYATISKELNLPLRFPGKPGAYHSLLEMTDAALLAKATVWAATEPNTGNEAFNINNGDLFRWSELWPKLAAYFNLDVAPPLPMSLSVVMADKATLWQTIVTKYNLQATPYEDLSSWIFGDFVFSWDYDMFADGSKARRYGFHEYVETEQMFYKIFDELRVRKIIP